MTTFHWIRHGPTHAKTMVGWSDLPADLSDTGLIGRVSRHLPPDALVISSDLSRAVTTADAIAGSRQRLPHDPALREIHFGDWEMRRFDEIEDQNHIRAYWEQPGDVRPPGGESWNEVVNRVDTVVDGLANTHPDAHLIAVAHFGVILTQLQRALKMDTIDIFGHHIDNFSITEIHFDGRAWSAGKINHLP